MSSPPPFYNFATIPTVNCIDPFWAEKEARAKDGKSTKRPIYEDIHMPHNTSVGFWLAIISGVVGFAIVWHIIWLVIIGFIALVLTTIARTFDMNTDYYVKAKDVEAIETKHLQRAAQ